MLVRYIFFSLREQGTGNGEQQAGKSPNTCGYCYIPDPDRI
jgi:hypothetical protein